MNSLANANQTIYSEKKQKLEAIMAQENVQFTPGFGNEKFGGDFFPDAKPNPDELVTDLIEGTSLSVFGLRRIGKSSLLAETRERLRAMGKKVIWVDMDKYDTLTKALAVVLSSIHHGNRSGVFARFRTWVDNSKVVPAIFKSRVGALISAVVDRYSKDYETKYIEVLSDHASRLLETHDPDTKPIIIFDELTTLIKKTILDSEDEKRCRVVGRLNSFLGLLRSLRKADVGIVMAVSGSVSIDRLQEEYKIRSDSINDCVSWSVEEMDRQGAKNLFEMCVEAKALTNWNEQLTENLLDFLPSFYPGVVQLAFRTVSKHPTPVSKLDDSIRETIDAQLWRYYFKQLDDFYQEFTISEQNRILRLFDALCKSASGKIGVGKARNIVSNEDLADGELSSDAIISRLLAESFLGISTNGVEFFSGLVSAWYRIVSKDQESKP